MLRNVAVLLFGVGIGAIGLDWLTPNSEMSGSPTIAPEPAPNSSRYSEFDSPDRNTRSSASQRPTSLSVEDEVANATVCVRGVMPDGEQVCASGVSIDPELAGVDPDQGSVIVTNFHVVANTGDRPPILLGGKGEAFNSEVIRQSPEMDLALLFIREAQLPIAALAESSPAQGTAVRAIGFPNNSPLTVRDSTLLGKTDNCLAIAPCLAIRQGTITHGNSGGPLEADGQVIGITQGETMDEIAIPVEQVRQFLAGQTPPASRRSPQFNPDYANPRRSYPGGYPGGYPGDYPGGYPPPPFDVPPPYGW
jgi:S1-C subfamily serine protease